MMRAIVLAAAAALAAGAGQAQPAPPAPPAPPPTPPRVFLAAGYAEPDITPGFCRNKDVSQTVCTIPAMTAGRYLVEATGTSTATSDGAIQELIIVAGDQAGNQSCSSRRDPDPKAPWAVGSRRTFHSACIFTFITDTPLLVAAVYADAKGTKDPKGPTLSVRRLPWVGVISANPQTVPQQ